MTYAHCSPTAGHTVRTRRPSNSSPSHTECRGNVHDERTVVPGDAVLWSLDGLRIGS